MTSPPVRILVVEDNDALRENLAEALVLEGYDVRVAANGLEALQRLEQEAVAAVLLDLVMPGMDGRELLRRLRDDPRFVGLRVIVTTGHSGARARAGVPADAFLLKPFGVGQLLAALRGVGVGVASTDDSAA
jgi:CheY-like chemotaxis protein